MEKSKETLDPLHILFFPYMAQGHLIPAVHMAKLFASRGHRSTIIATSSFAQFLSDSLKHRPNIATVPIKIPSSEVGLADDVDSAHGAKTPDALQLFLKACSLLGPQTEDILNRLRPDCLVADIFFPWAIGSATALGIPALVFGGSSFFSMCASLSVFLHRPHDKASSDSEAFLIPNLPDEIEFTRSRIPEFVKHDDGSELVKVFGEMRRMEKKSHGHLVNSFLELERPYSGCFRDVFGKKAWHIGPLFLHDQTAEPEEHECLEWLDSKEADSVVYVSFGSVANFGNEQLREIAAGLEASGKQFVWVVKKKEKEEEWLPEGFERRTEGRGMIVRGWAPQVKILGHDSVGGFVTHCGWNSTLEGICSGVLMATWPLFAEQFYNERLVCQVLGVGAEVGVTKWSMSGGDLVGREAVERAVNRVMEGEEADGMRTRVKKLAVMARKAVQEGGSSYLDLDSFFRDLRSHKLATTDV